MPEPERRLAAILSADVVGYSRLMADDEDATVRTLRAYREEVELLLRQHRGRLVDFTGDNFLAEFASAVESVRCAVQIQRALGARNADLSTERRVELRIGAHVGDVRVEGDQLFGDGVNIAARLEGQAEPGGICISRSLHEQVRKTPGLSFDALGERALKNLPEPVEIYAVRWSERAEAPAKSGAAEPPRAVAVLPFINMSPDPAQEFFSDGMAEELINALTRVEGLRVIARTSAFAFKGKNADIATIGARLGASHVVEGSVRRAGDKLRITAQLIDVAGGHHLWSEVYDRQLADVFEVQDEIARTIVATIGPKLLGDRAAPLVPRATESQEAYDLYLRAGERIARWNHADFSSAISMLDHATSLDPRFANAWARLSLACCQMEALFEPNAHWYERSERALESGLALDPANSEAQLARGRLLWMPRAGFRNREALRALREALRVQPGLHDARYWDALILAHVGLLEDSERKLVELIGPHPTNAGEVQTLAQVLQLQGRFGEAVERQRQALALDPGGHYAQIMHAPVLLYADDLAGAEQALLIARRLMGDDPLFDASEALLWAKRGEPERAEAAITSSERPRASLSHTHHTLHWAAAACALLGREEDAVAKLRTAANTGLPNYLAFARDPHFETIRGRPAMQALLQELERDWLSYRDEFGTAEA